MKKRSFESGGFSLLRHLKWLLPGVVGALYSQVGSSTGGRVTWAAALVALFVLALYFPSIQERFEQWMESKIKGASRVLLARVEVEDGKVSVWHEGEEEMASSQEALVREREKGDKALQLVKLTFRAEDLKSAWKVALLQKEFQRGKGGKGVFSATLKGQRRQLHLLGSYEGALEKCQLYALAPSAQSASSGFSVEKYVQDCLGIFGKGASSRAEVGGEGSKTDVPPLQQARRLGSLLKPGLFIPVSPDHRTAEQPPSPTSSLLPPHQGIPPFVVKEEPDLVSASGHKATDGCGEISSDLVEAIAMHLIEEIKFAPNGCSGVMRVRNSAFRGLLVQNASLPSRTVVFRTSQKKFHPAEPLEKLPLHLVALRPPRRAVLSLPLMAALQCQGVSDRVFEALLKRHHSHAASLLEDGEGRGQSKSEDLRVASEASAFTRRRWLDALFAAEPNRWRWQIVDAMTSARIPTQVAPSLPKERRVLFKQVCRDAWKRLPLSVSPSPLSFSGGEALIEACGVWDVSGTLKKGEVFFQWPCGDSQAESDTEAMGDAEKSGRKQTSCIEGKGFVWPVGDHIRSPSNLQIVRFVRVSSHPQLSHLSGVLVFNTQDEIPLCQQLGGSDLDGDRFVFSVSPTVIPPASTPSCPSPSSTKLEKEKKENAEAERKEEESEDTEGKEHVCTSSNLFKALALVQEAKEIRRKLISTESAFLGWHTNWASASVSSFSSELEGLLARSRASSVLKKGRGVSEEEVLMFQKKWEGGEHTGGKPLSGIRWDFSHRERGKGGEVLHSPCAEGSFEETETAKGDKKGAGSLALASRSLAGRLFRESKKLIAEAEAAARPMRRPIEEEKEEKGENVAEGGVKVAENESEGNMEEMQQDETKTQQKEKGKGSKKKKEKEKEKQTEDDPGLCPLMLFWADAFPQPRRAALLRYAKDFAQRHWLSEGRLPMSIAQEEKGGDVGERVEVATWEEEEGGGEGESAQGIDLGTWHVKRQWQSLLHEGKRRRGGGTGQTMETDAWGPEFRKRAQKCRTVLLSGDGAESLGRKSPQRTSHCALALLAFSLTGEGVQMFGGDPWPFPWAFAFPELCQLNENVTPSQ
uniref:RNA-dependent RNA polymerase n=1 Tax=Chromera velia CCMP2878 TaxID=1169474 RepID=A0A0G4GYV3_9ALVE|eukprot:Cvel_5391.t1-p1 / transcript=Cvel_5391.t1 / gene=Cvel_5391 / organism=Chromera_velia_CCMP2878 / gene_product=hypothetical protein / transcript_product=hypothetical protein / location=Cvel_scaffold251:581-4556(+) / protein_length=1092 / sequence_SO=supercontig / SO=protein_coding / is_pseudo=false